MREKRRRVANALPTWYRAAVPGHQTGQCSSRGQKRDVPVTRPENTREWPPFRDGIARLGTRGRRGCVLVDDASFSLTPSPSMSSIGDRLQNARSHLFVGRDAEVERFQDALAAETLPFHVLHVFGPGGVGKTELLQAFARCCDAEGCASHLVDARDVDPSPEAFRTALRRRIGVGAETPVLTAFDTRDERDDSTFPPPNSRSPSAERAFSPSAPPGSFGRSTCGTSRAFSGASDCSPISRDAPRLRATDA